MTSRLTNVLAGLLAAAGLLLANLTQAETWRFAVIGDTPYNSYEEQELPLMLDDIAAENPQLIVHAGDFKDSRMRCSDQLFLERRALFDASRVPLIYVPGDNDWADCHQLTAGHYDPLERLQKLREIFFAAPRSLGKRTIAVERQPGAYPEQLRWRLGPVLFVSLNVPGPNNNWGMGAKPGAEYLARNPQVIEWLEQAFAKARREQAAAIVIVMQANPGFKHYAAGLGHAGYRQLLDTLRRETLGFPGQVLLIHGDTHWRRIDQPLRDPVSKLPIANFTRLETFGYPLLGWVKVIVDSEQAELFRFEVHPHQRR
ncbi:MAG: metallophosphoesterase [Rhodobacteraceae bacterium]|nr:metallophosphoesterase [Paracoccaceae bacterium]